MAHVRVFDGDAPIGRHALPNLHTALGARLEMHWADTRVQVPVTVGLGETLAITAEEARPYLGTWRLTRLKTFSDSAEAEWKQEMTPEEIAEFDAWFTPTDATILHDPERNWLLIEDEPDEPGPDGLLMPRGAHQFRPGWIWKGDLVQIDKGAIVTFTVGANGTATRAEMRERDDKLSGVLERTGIDPRSIHREHHDVRHFLPDVPVS